jgi:hypothetical protein
VTSAEPLLLPPQIRDRIFVCKEFERRTTKRQTWYYGSHKFPQERRSNGRRRTGPTTKAKLSPDASPLP